MKTIALLAVTAALFSFASENNKLAGRWESQPFDDGVVMGALFRDNGSFEGTSNGYVFAYGSYKTANDTVTFTDNTCNGAEAKYKLLFFGNGDSLRLQAISDDCWQRRSRIEKAVMGRMK